MSFQVLPSSEYWAVKASPVRVSLIATSLAALLAEGDEGPYFRVLFFNRHRFGGMDPNFSNSTFGRATVASFPRFIQLGARIRF